eukprot:1900305-Amphidinium_carterae.1
MQRTHQESKGCVQAQSICCGLHLSRKSLLEAAILGQALTRPTTSMTRQSGAICQGMCFHAMNPLANHSTESATPLYVQWVIIGSTIHVL